jgi:hypothetical protein
MVQENYIRPTLIGLTTSNSRLIPPLVFLCFGALFAGRPSDHRNGKFGEFAMVGRGETAWQKRTASTLTDISMEGPCKLLLQDHATR